MNSKDAEPSSSDKACARITISVEHLSGGATGNFQRIVYPREPDERQWRTDRHDNYRMPPKLPQPNADVAGITWAQCCRDDLPRSINAVRQFVIGQGPKPRTLRRRIDDGIADVEGEAQLKHRKREEGQEAAHHDKLGWRRTPVAPRGLNNGGLEPTLSR
jgi:hypothetical protein